VVEVVVEVDEATAMVLEVVVDSGSASVPAQATTPTTNRPIMTERRISKP